MIRPVICPIIRPLSALLLVPFGGLGCGSRQHLYATSGLAERAAFREQIARRPDLNPPRPLSSIDAEINLQNYQAAFTRRAGFSAMAATAGPSLSGSGVTGAELSTLPNQKGYIQLQAK